jgi:hypothetical protein
MHDGHVMEKHIDLVTGIKIMDVSEGWTSISGLLKWKAAKVFQLNPDIL